MTLYKFQAVGGGISFLFRSFFFFFFYFWYAELVDRLTQADPMTFQYSLWRKARNRWHILASDTAWTSNGESVSIRDSFGTALGTAHVFRCCFAWFAVCLFLCLRPKAKQVGPCHRCVPHLERLKMGVTVGLLCYVIALFWCGSWLNAREGCFHLTGVEAVTSLLFLVSQRMAVLSLARLSFIH